MPLRAVLFDLDDTLHDKSATLHLVASKQFSQTRLAALNVQETAWIAAYLALNNQRIAKTAVFAQLQQQFALTDAVTGQLLADFDTNFGQYAVPFPGVLQLLQQARAYGLKIGVVTNGRDRFQRSKIEGMGLTPYLDAIVTSGGLGIKKPDFAIFHACLNALGVTPTDAAFVGDDLQADIAPAVELGMLAVWKSPHQSGLAHFCSDHLADIGYFLLQHAQAKTTCV